jgi:hypothetical protein
MDESSYSAMESYFEALCREMEADEHDVPAVWSQAA